jgi:hypothetical protein
MATPELYQINHKKIPPYRNDMEDFLYLWPQYDTEKYIPRIKTALRNPRWTARCGCHVGDGGPQFYTSHCTGDKVFAILKAVMGEELQPFCCGTTIKI